MYNGYTESESKIHNRFARMQLGGYGWFPKTEDKQEQVKILENITAEAHEQHHAETLWRIEREIETLEQQDAQQTQEDARY